MSSLGGTESVSVTPGHKYGIDVAGTFYAGGNDTYDIRADAEYSQDAYQRANGLPWTDSVHDYESSGEELLDLQIDGQDTDWGAYSSTHEYSMEKVATDGAISFGFSIYDIYSPNNTGGLCVALRDLGNAATFEGFFAPINDEEDSVKAGQSVPVKWRILDYNGDPVSDLTLADISLTMTADACDAVTFDPVEVYTGESGLQYLGDGYWQYNWKTAKAWARGCGTMTLTVQDHTVDTAYFLFR